MIRWIDSGLLAELEGAGTTSHRLGSGEDGWVERFGPDVLISSRVEANFPAWCDGMFAWAEVSGFGVGRVFARSLVKGPGERDVPRQIAGGGGSPRVVAKELGRDYLIDFGAGYSIGLFCDQRLNRARFDESPPGRLLNCFAYTCSFSVVAAGRGAQTVSLDLARKALDRGRENFALNGLSLEGHRFIADDVFDVLPRLVRRGEKFDAIVLDPPSFSRGRGGRVFRAAADLAHLAGLALACLSPGGRLLLSTNCAGLGTGELRRIALDLADGARVIDGVRPPDFSPGHGAASVWVELPR